MSELTDLEREIVEAIVLKRQLQKELESIREKYGLIEERRLLKDRIANLEGKIDRAGDRVLAARAAQGRTA